MIFSFIPSGRRLLSKRWLYFGLIAISMILAIAFANFTTLSPVTAQQPTTTLTVSAGAGLKEVMEEVKQVYNQSQPNVSITYNFAASGVLQRQIEQGANIDVFISASTENMNALQRQGLLLGYTRKNLVKSRVVLIVPQNSTTISSFQDLIKPSVKKIAIGEPRSVPLGKYAEEVFRYFRILDKIQPKFVYTRSALQTLNLVETGNVDAGIIHDTNAKQSNLVKIVAIAPEKSHSPVVYPVAVLKNSKNISAAREFVKFLFSNQAKALFQKYGYQTL